MQATTVSRLTNMIKTRHCEGHKQHGNLIKYTLSPKDCRVVPPRNDLSF